MNADGIGEARRSEPKVRAAVPPNPAKSSLAEDGPHAAGPRFVIEPSRGFSFPDLREFWRYRELLYFMVWRDVKSRFKQTALGATWVILQPLLTMLVFTIFFGRLAGVPSEGVPYPIYTFAALLPWQLFAHAVTQSGGSLVDNRSLLTKVYFPRLVMPVSGVVVGLVDFVLAFLVLLVMMLYYRMAPTPAVAALPLLVLLACMTALAVGLWLAVLNVRYRDVRLAIPFFLQVWLFMTPIAYPASLVPEQWRILYALNPMVGVVEGFRWALLGTPDTLHPSAYVSVGMVAVLLIGGLLYFRRMERTFADEV